MYNNIEGIEKLTQWGTNTMIVKLQNNANTLNTVFTNGIKIFHRC